MYVDKLSLKDYRNINILNIELKKGVNIFYGNNAQGKTNILESIYMCATGRSHRTHVEKELIKFGESEAHIQLYVKKDVTDRIDIHLKREEKKGIAINNIPIKKLGELFGILNVVMFGPEDLQLIKSGPSERRRFMDMELCQISNVYYYNLQQYYKILKQRNNLLKNLQKDIRNKDTLDIWDEQMVQYGNKIIISRQNFINKITEIADKIHRNITNSKEILKIEYKPSITTDIFREKLNKNIDKDIYYGTTSCGIHKDDLYFYINDINVREYGSQGQQRTACLSTKLAEIDLIKNEKNESPVLLLDDVLSELDKERQHYLINNIYDVQTILTCTGIEDAIKNMITDANIYKVSNGAVNRV